MTATLQTLVDRWLAGFCRSRGVAMRRVDPIIEVDVGAESRRLELVGVELTQDQVTATAARLVDSPDVWCTLFTAEPHGYELPPGIRVELHGEALMTLALGAPSGRPTRAVVEVDGEVAIARVWAGEVVAASGVVAVVGADAVVDRVRTHDDHRRQGFGTDVMTALGDWAAGRGATTGILAASPDGQALYSRLGWRVAGAMVTLSSGLEAPA